MSPAATNPMQTAAMHFARVLNGQGLSFKYPDTSSTKTIPFISNMVTTIATTGGGRAATCIFPGKLVKALHHATTFDGTSHDVLTWDVGTDVPAYATLNAAMQKVRVIAARIDIEFIHNAFNNEGQIALKVANATSQVPSIVDQPVNFNSPVVRWAYGSLKSGGRFICTPLDNTAYHYFTPSTDDVTVTSPWGAYFIFIEGGAASTSVVQVTLTQFIEMIPDSNSFNAHVATPSAPDNSLVRSAINRTYSVLDVNQQTVVANRAGASSVASVANATRTAFFDPHINIDMGDIFG